MRAPSTKRLGETASDEAPALRGSSVAWRLGRDAARIRRPGSLTSWLASPSIPPSQSMRFRHGTGGPARRRPRRPDAFRVTSGGRRGPWFVCRPSADVSCSLRAISPEGEDLSAIPRLSEGPCCRQGRARSRPWHASRMLTLDTGLFSAPTAEGSCAEVAKPVLSGATSSRKKDGGETRSAMRALPYPRYIRSLRSRGGI
jgi:hypothetical protein